MKRALSVLTIEDDDLRFLTVHALKNLGVKTLEATSMAETLNLLMGGTVPDLILLDLRLPDGRGETLLREIRVIPGCTNVKIVLLSAERVLSTRAKELGVAGWIRKPAGRADIQTEVLKHLNAAFLSAL